MKSRMLDFGTCIQQTSMYPYTCGRTGRSGPTKPGRKWLSRQNFKVAGMQLRTFIAMQTGSYILWSKRERTHSHVA